MDNKQFDSKVELSVFTIDFQQVLYFGDGEIRSDPTFDDSFGKVE